MRKILSVCIACFVFMVSMSGCSPETQLGNPLISYENISVNHTNVNTLPALEVPGSSGFSPDNGVTLPEAQVLITGYLSQSGVKGDIRSRLQLTEITVKELWENTGAQMYRVDVDYAWLDGVAVIQNGKVLCVLDGMPTHHVFLGDLDYDGHYEIYTDVSFGSGIVSSEIRGYNIASDTRYSLSKRMEKDLLLFIRENALWVKEYSYGTPTDGTGEPVSTGKLSIKDEEGKKVLYVAADLPDSVGQSADNSFFKLPKHLTIDVVGSNRQQEITDKKTIKKIQDIIKGVDLKPMSDEDEAKIMLSSVGGLRITPDKNRNQAFYIHGAGAVYIPELLQKQLHFNKRICYLPKETIDELSAIVNPGVYVGDLLQTLKGIKEKYPVSSGIGQPATPKAESKDHEAGPGFAIYLVKNPDGYGMKMDDIYKFRQEKLEDLTLDDDPILTDEDLIAYHWKIPNQTEREEGMPSESQYVDLMELRDGKTLKDRLMEKTGSIARHFPFVAVAKGERIYSGLFFSPLSSLYPEGNQISIDYMMPFSENTYLLRQNASTDLLHDQRVYDVLKKVDKIKE